jgi:hypothetical protein
MNRERTIGLVCILILAIVTALGAYEAANPPEMCIEVMLGGMPWARYC